jgi:hypothetical protein
MSRSVSDRQLTNSSPILQYAILNISKQIALHISDQYQSVQRCYLSTEQVNSSGILYTQYIVKSLEYGSAIVSSVYVYLCWQAWLSAA